MGDKRPLVGALVLITIGVVAAILFRKPSEPTTSDAGESVLRRHEPVGLAAGARPFAVPTSESAAEATTDAAGPPAGLVGRISPVDVNVVGNTGAIVAVPPRDTAEVQRLPSVTSPPPDLLMQPSALSRQYPSTSLDKQPSTGEQPSVRQPAAATRIEAIWGTDGLESRPPVPPIADESTDVPRIRLHTIRDGDSLASLAERFLGDSGRYLEIYEANRDVLRSPEQLPIGRQLRIPRGGQKLTPSGTARRPGGPPSHNLPHDPNRLVPVTPRPPRS